MLAPGDRAVVVISNELAKNTFEQEIRLNQMIPLNGKSYRVIGILAKDGGFLEVWEIFLGAAFICHTRRYTPFGMVKSMHPKEKGCVRYHRGKAL
jgi:hypothetical protein